MGYPLHGHELTLSISPVEASASWAVFWDKEFWGKKAMLAQRESKNHRSLHAIKIDDRGIPRADMAVFDENNQEVGVITSGTFSPTLKTGIALALLSRKIPIGNSLFIDIRGRRSSGKVTRLPFVPSRVK